MAEFNTQEIDEAVDKSIAEAKKNDAPADPPAGDPPPGDDQKNNPPTKTTAEIEAEAKVQKEADEKAAAGKAKNEEVANEILGRLGFKTEDELKAALAKAKAPVDETPEEKAKRENIEKAEMLAHAAKEGIKVEDITQYETLKATADQELVFKGYLASWREENPDAKPEEVEAAARAEFEAEYKLTSTNEKAKARGEAKIAKEAAEIRAPYEKSYNTAKEKYTEHTQLVSKVGEFNKFIDTVSQTAIPSSVEVYKKGDDVVNFEVSAEEKKAITDTVLKQPEVFTAFSKHGDSQQVKELIEKKVNEQIFLRNREAIASVIAEAKYSKGLKEGSKAGASKPFALNKPAQKEKTNPTKEDAKNNTIKYMEETFR